MIPSITMIKIIYFRHTVKELQILLFNTDDSIQNYSFVCTQLNDSQYYYDKNNLL